MTDQLTMPPRRGLGGSGPGSHRKDIPVALYRMFSETSQLLYIGQSCNPADRLVQHRFSSDWILRVRSITVEWFPNRTAAMAAESAAIKGEKPLFNVEHARPRPRLLPPPGGTILRRWLEQNGLSVSSFAASLGERPQRIQAIISKGNKPNGTLPYEIAKATKGMVPMSVWERPRPMMEGGQQ